MNTKCRSLTLLALAAAMPIGCRRTEAAAGADVTAPLVAARSVPAWQLEALEVAFRAASALPLQPHIKDRARAQEAVVAACLKLDQYDRARAWADEIPDWRKGTAVADCALHLAKHGRASEVQPLLDLAQRISESAPSVQEQEWRRDRIRARIARVHLEMAQPEKASPFEVGLVDFEAGAVQLTKLARLTAADLADCMKRVDAAIEAGTFESIRNALEMCAVVFDVRYDDPAQRGSAEDKIKAKRPKLPVRIGIDIVQKLVDSAVAHGDTRKATELARELHTMVDTARWTPEDRIAVLARLAVARFRVGEQDAARDELASLFTSFENERTKMVNIDRAGALRPLAEAWSAIGEQGRAIEIYKRALEEGLDNPNSRPRAEDLVATCCSLAVSGTVPDAVFRARMQSILKGLGNPW